MPKFYIPRSKADKLKELLPTWAGSKTDLRKMTNRRLGAILRDKKTRKMRDLMKTDEKRAEVWG